MRSYTGTDHDRDYARGPYWRAYRRDAFRLYRTETRARGRGHHLHSGRNRAGRLARRLAYGGHPCSTSHTYVTVINVDHSHLDRRAVCDRLRRRPRVVHRAAVHPRALADAPARSDGRSERRRHHRRPGDCVRD